MAENAFLGFGKLLKSRQFPAFGIKEVILAGVNGDGDRVAVAYARFVLTVERLPGGLTRFPFDKNIYAALRVVLVTWLHVFVVKNATKFPHTILHVIGFDVIDNVVMRNDFFMLVVEETLEFDAFWLLFKLVCGKVVVDKSDDFGSVSCTVVFRWH